MCDCRRTHLLGLGDIGGQTRQQFRTQAHTNGHKNTGLVRRVLQMLSTSPNTERRVLSNHCYEYCHHSRVRLPTKPSARNGRHPEAGSDLPAGAAVSGATRPCRPDLAWPEGVPPRPLATLEFPSDIVLEHGNQEWVANITEAKHYLYPVHVSQQALPGPPPHSSKDGRDKFRRRP